MQAADGIDSSFLKLVNEFGGRRIALVLPPEKCESLDVERSLSDNFPDLNDLLESSSCKEPILEDDCVFAVRSLVSWEPGDSEVFTPNCLMIVQSKWGGVLTSPSPFDVSIDLTRLTGRAPAGVVCKLQLNSNTHGQNLASFANEHDLPQLSIKDLISLRLSNSKNRYLKVGNPVNLPTKYGIFTTRAIEDLLTGKSHAALVMGDVSDGSAILSRVHSECLTGDVLGSLRCDCGSQLELAMKKIGEKGQGVLLYLRQEGRGIGLSNKLRAYALQERGFDTVEANHELGFAADLREFGVAAHIFSALGIQKIQLMTNNPSKVKELEKNGIEIVKRVPIQSPSLPENMRYLTTKKVKMGHLFHPTNLAEHQE